MRGLFTGRCVCFLSLMSHLLILSPCVPSDWGLSESLPAEQVNESTMTHNTMGTRTQTEVTKGFSGDGAAHVQSFGHELLGCSPGT